MKNLSSDLASQSRQIIKYIIAGGSGALTQIVVLYILTDLAGIWYLLSAILAFVIAIFVGFYLQKFWTFRCQDKQAMGRQLFFYFTLNLINLCINTIVLYLLVDIFGIWYILAQIIISAILAVSNYIIYKLAIFKPKTAAGSQIKILLATGIYPPDIGGPATMIESLVSQLKKDNYLVKVITYSDKSGATDELVKISRRHHSLIKYSKYFWSMLKLSGWADVIYATDTYSVGYFAYLIKVFTGKKYIIRFAGDSAWETATGRGWTEDYLVDFLKRTYNRNIEIIKRRRQKILVNADRVIVVSNFMSQVASLIGVASDKIRIIYNSIDFRPAASGDKSLTREIKEHYGQNSKIIMTACRLTPWKGVDGIIKILPQLIAKVGAVNFLILGDGPAQAKLEELARQLGVDKSVHFLGRVNNAEVIDYFRAADLFILNSNYEGMSHTILEAMTAQTPIVATNVGGNPELIKDKEEGLLIGYNNLEQLLSAASLALSDNILAKSLAAKAKEKLAKYSWANTVRQTEEVIKEIVYG